MVMQPLETMLARDVEPGVIVEAQGLQLVVGVTVHSFHELRQGLVTLAGELSHRFIGPAKQIEATLEEIAMHGIDVFLVPKLVSLRLFLEKKGFESRAQPLVVGQHDAPDRDREEIVYSELGDLHAP